MLRMRTFLSVVTLFLLQVKSFGKANTGELLIEVNGQQQRITRLMKERDIPGLTITLIKDYSIAWTKTYGVKKQDDDSPIKENTLFQAASISKSLTAALVLNEASKGTWNLNDDVNTLLHSWKIPQNSYTKQSPVLLGQLMDHSSGLSVSGFDGYSFQDKLPTVIEILSGETSSSGATVNSGTIFVDTLPGKRFRYSGGAYTVLQLLLMEHFDTSFTTLMEKQLLNKLHMSSSTFRQPLLDSDTMRAATGHTDSAQLVPGNYNRYPEQAAAGLWTTSTDLAKFVIDIQKSLKDGSGLLLDQQSAEKMSSPKVAPFVGYGLFLREPNSEEKGYFQHEGWNKGYSSMFIAHKYKGYGVVILTNANKPDVIKEIIASIAKENNWTGL